MKICRAVGEFPLQFVAGDRPSQYETWPETLDDSEARDQWGFEPHFGLEEMTNVMLEQGKESLSEYKKASKKTKKETKQ